MNEYFLDTNAYFLFFQNPKTPKTDQYNNLLKEIDTKGQIFFHISEITSLEIHSVLGKYRRGAQSQKQNCERDILTPKCSNTWVTKVRKILFHISEITSSEIHSVLGKYRRGAQSQTQNCKCSNIWITRARKKLELKVYRDLQKMVSDIEAKKGSIQADVIKLNTCSIEIGTNLLIKYSDSYNFGSHDALIMGSFIDARNKMANLIIVTSDKGMKAVLKDESLPYFDPK